MKLITTALAGLAALVIGGCAPRCERPRVYFPPESHHPEPRCDRRASLPLSTYQEYETGNRAKLLIFGTCTQKITDNMYSYALGQLISVYHDLEFSQVQPFEQEQATQISRDHRLNQDDLVAILGEDTGIAFVAEISCDVRDKANYPTIGFHTFIMDVNTGIILKSGAGAYDFFVERPERHSPLINSMIDFSLHFSK